jgi:ubiquinone/menaquinone biosynthesis C-methylase UbiE
MKNENRSDNDPAILKADREAYNSYIRKKNGANSDNCNDFLFEQFASSYISELYKREFDGYNKILEIGAGSAFPSIHISPFVKNAIVLDHNIDPGCGLHAACTLAHSKGRSLHYVQGSYEKIPLQDETVDGIIAQSCLHHAIRPSEVLKETFRVLRPGGRLMIIEPCRGICTSEQFSQRHYWKMPGMDPIHMNEHTYSLSTWIKWLRYAGYNKITFESTYLQWAASFLKRHHFIYLSRLLNSLSGLINFPYLSFAFFFGHLPVIPHQFTRKITGFEYFEVRFTARKHGNI